MDCNIERAQSLLVKDNTTKEELEKVLKDIVDNYSTRPRIVIYLDDYNHTREEIINAVAENCYCNFGYEPDFYTCCMEERKRFEGLVDDLEHKERELLGEEDKDEIKDIKERMGEIVSKLESDFGVDYTHYLEE